MTGGFKNWLWIHLEQALGFVGGFSYAFVNIHLSLQVREYVVKIIAALFVGFMTAVGGWLFRVLVKAFTPKQKHTIYYNDKHESFDDKRTSSGKKSETI